MQRFGTGSSRSWCGRAGTATIAAVLLASGALTGLPPAYAISPPTIDPGALPPDGPPGPLAPMKQNAYCTEVGVLPGTDFQLQPKYMEMLNLNEAWQFGRGDGVKVAVIDTGVTPHPRLPRLIPGGDYVMAGGDGLSDCDAHGTLVASMIAAVPANGGGTAAVGTAQAGHHSHDRNAAAATDGDPFTGTAADRDRDSGSTSRGRSSAGRTGARTGAAAGSWSTAAGRGPRWRHGDSTQLLRGRKIAPIDNPRNPHPSAPSPALGPPPDAFSGIAPVSR